MLVRKNGHHHPTPSHRQPHIKMEDKRKLIWRKKEIKGLLVKSNIKILNKAIPSIKSARPTDTETVSPKLRKTTEKHDAEFKATETEKPIMEEKGILQKKYVMGTVHHMELMNEDDGIKISSEENEAVKNLNNKYQVLQFKMENNLYPQEDKKCFRGGMVHCQNDIILTITDSIADPNSFKLKENNDGNKENVVEDKENNQDYGVHTPVSNNLSSHVAKQHDNPEQATVKVLKNRIKAKSMADLGIEAYILPKPNAKKHSDEKMVAESKVEIDNVENNNKMITIGKHKEKYPTQKEWNECKN